MIVLKKMDISNQRSLNPMELYCPVPQEKYNYFDKNPEHFNYVPEEGQVDGSTSRYCICIVTFTLVFVSNQKRLLVASCTILITMIAFTILTRTNKKAPRCM